MTIRRSIGFRRGSQGGIKGLTADNPAASAVEAKASGASADGIYYINLPTVGVTPVYCIMNPAADGGGWMMAMKATTGTTFAYGSTHWTTVSTLVPSDTTRNNADAKFNTMNYFQAKDIMALWPDIATNGGGLGSNPYSCWSWLENDFYGGTRTTLISFFSTVNRRFIKDAKTWNGWQSGIFSSQVDIRFYGFNWTDNYNTRWGFGWNENGGGLYPGGVTGSDDVWGGIGTNYSAGDYISCCQDTTGINRSARVEIYIR
jgi:hypothetical protein